MLLIDTLWELPLFVILEYFLESGLVTFFIFKVFSMIARAGYLVKSGNLGQEKSLYLDRIIGPSVLLKTVEKSFLDTFVKVGMAIVLLNILYILFNFIIDNNYIQIFSNSLFLVTIFILNIFFALICSYGLRYFVKQDLKTI